MTTFRIWYLRPELSRFGAKPDAGNLSATHIHLMDVELPVEPGHAGDDSSLEQLFHDMQGEIWSPNGEARGLIERKGLRHTSMSVGDVVEIPAAGETWVVAAFGFKPVTSTETVT